MANISQFLVAIKNAVYGEEVRNSIHDAIEAMNDENNGVVQDIEEAISTDIKSFIEDYLSRTIDQEAIEQSVSGLINDSWVDLSQYVSLTLRTPSPDSSITWDWNKKIFKANPVTRQVELDLILTAWANGSVKHITNLYDYIQKITISSNSTMVGLLTPYFANLHGNDSQIQNRVNEKLLSGTVVVNEGPSMDFWATPIIYAVLSRYKELEGTLDLSTYDVQFCRNPHLESLDGDNQYITISTSSQYPTMFHLYMTWTY